jgi:hypothetical protein
VASVWVTVLPLEERDYVGSLSVESNDPAGPTMATLDAIGLDGAICDGRSRYDVSFEADYKIADIAFLIDTTGSMGSTATAMATEFAAISGALSGRIPDITFGVATYDDYNSDPFGQDQDKPFILRQQQTDNVARVADVLATQVVLHNGWDWPESGHEAIFQAASGDGYDQDCDQNYDAIDDVKPFIPSPGDAFGGMVAGTYNEEVEGTGDVGGMGFRERVFPIMILATDADLRDPEAGYASPGGCSQDASMYHAYTAMAEIGAKFIGVAVNMPGGIGRAQLTNLAIVTDSYGDMDGYFLLEPAVVDWNGTSAEFRELVVNAVLSLVDSAWFDKIALEYDDPQGLIVEVLPEAYYNVQAGTQLDFNISVTGTVVEVETATTEAIELRLVADDEIVLGTRMLIIEP